MDFLLVVGALSVSFANGANDNFKGFATVWGSDTLSYRTALTLATLSTAAGCIASVFLANALVHNFSGRGLVPDDIVAAPAFMASVAAGAGLTILLATRFGYPVSTTHALIGGLVGSALACEAAISLGKLAGTFFVPLLISPLLAAAAAWILFRLVRRRSRAAACACIVADNAAAPALSAGAVARQRLGAMPRLVVDSDAACDRLETPVRVSVPRALNRLHVLSGMAICFARSVNDTPKLAALLIAANLLDVRLSVFAIAVAMVVGGALGSARVAHTMSKRVTRLDHAQGLSANLITALLVLLASKFGLPVSTTHVSVAAIAGVGASGSSLDRGVLRKVLLSWVITLPIAAAAAFVLASVISG